MVTAIVLSMSIIFSLFAHAELDQMMEAEIQDKANAKAELFETLHDSLNRTQAHRSWLWMTPDEVQVPISKMEGVETVTAQLGVIVSSTCWTCFTEFGHFKHLADSVRVFMIEQDGHSLFWKNRGMLLNHKLSSAKYSEEKGSCEAGFLGRNRCKTPVVQTWSWKIDLGYCESSLCQHMEVEAKRMESGNTDVRLRVITEGLEPSEWISVKVP